VWLTPHGITGESGANSAIDIRIATTTHGTVMRERGYCISGATTKPVLTGVATSRASKRTIRSSSKSTSSVELEPAFLLRDKLAKAGKVLTARFVTHVVVRDIDNAEGLLDFAEVVSHPGESAGKVLDVGPEEDGKRLAIATRVENALVAIGESDFELVDGAVGEVRELESSGASAIAEELL
jgi:hypothetical protein